MSVVTEKSKCRILKLASMLAVTMGIIMAFYAFYIMSELYSFSATEQGKALYMVVKLLNIAFIAVIVEGVYFAIAGFYGMTNIGAVDAVNKIKVYGIVMTIAGVVDLIIVFVVSKYSITGNMLILICLPVVIGIMYLGGAFYNEKLIEQLVRIGTIILYVRIKNASIISIADAVTGNIFGELAAATYCAIPLFFRSIHNKSMTQKLSCSLREYRYIVKYAFPINANQTVLHLLEGAEAILIPAILCMHGLSKDDAISQFGILTGMALPLVLFPCTAANSFALMLLPKVSDESSNVLSDHLAVTVKRTVSMCLSLGIISIFLFINYGARLGAMMFHEDSVYIYTCILSWLCPFLYLKISLTSVTNGMGHTALTFIINITGIIIRLACVFLLIPKLGITGYLYGVLISNICMSLLYIFNIYKKLNIQPDPFGSIIVPLCIAVISIFSSRIICRIVFGLIIKEAEEYTLLLTGAAICCIVYIILFIHEQSEQRPL
jgi:stage V sporulation protein B